MRAGLVAGTSVSNKRRSNGKTVNTKRSVAGSARSVFCGSVCEEFYNERFKSRRCRGQHLFGAAIACECIGQGLDKGAMFGCGFSVEVE